MSRSTLPFLVAATIVAGTSVAGRAAAASRSVVFPFEDERYLQPATKTTPAEKNGGLAFVTDGATTAPLIVFLHGTNERGPLHRWFGAPGIDLRPFFDGLVARKKIAEAIVAAPSQTRDAWTGSRLWADFDLDAFVAATDAALPTGIAVDRARVIVVGHSGAGCNATGGLLGRHGAIEPIAIVAIDTCLDARFGALFGARAELAPVFVEWQPTWSREPIAFEEAFAAALAERPGRRGTITKTVLPGDDAHEAIVASSLARLLPGLIPPASDD
jgi:poly(3-hydroxybutyrate) depolymerase